MSQTGGNGPMHATPSDIRTRPALIIFLENGKGPEIPKSRANEKRSGRALASERSSIPVWAKTLSRISESSRARSDTSMEAEVQEGLRTVGSVPSAAESSTGRGASREEPSTAVDNSDLASLLVAVAESTAPRSDAEGEASSLASTVSAKRASGHAGLCGTREEPGTRKSSTKRLEPDRVTEERLKGSPDLPKPCANSKDPGPATSSIASGNPGQSRPNADAVTSRLARLCETRTKSKLAASKAEAGTPVLAHPKRESTKSRWQRLRGSGVGSSSAASRAGEEVPKRVPKTGKGVPGCVCRRSDSRLPHAKKSKASINAPEQHIPNMDVMVSG